MIITRSRVYRDVVRGPVEEIITISIDRDILHSVRLNVWIFRPVPDIVTRTNSRDSNNSTITRKPRAFAGGKYLIS